MEEAERDANQHACSRAYAHLRCSARSTGSNLAQPETADVRGIDMEARRLLSSANCSHGETKAWPENGGLQCREFRARRRPPFLNAKTCEKVLICKALEPCRLENQRSLSDAHQTKCLNTFRCDDFKGIRLSKLPRLYELPRSQ